MSTNSYDEVPYDSLPFFQTHPDRLATLATLFGLPYPPLNGCRVLELGCAAGGNLIPLAEQIPDVDLVGVDLSAVQIATGQAIVDDLGLNNVRLVAASITDIDDSYGNFDYIICHGVYSWVPSAIQERILAICQERLSPNGIAYISYNTLPGWRMRGMIRDLMRSHALAFPNPQQRIEQARAILDFLAQAVPGEETAYSALLKNELEMLSRMPDAYIFHEHLEEVNEPVYFREFVERAASHGLKYLAETDFASMLASRFPPQVAETVQRIAPDIISQEQLMDFVGNRTFRQSLLIHDRVKVDRTISAASIEKLRIASPLTPVNAQPNLAANHPEAFRLANGATINTPSRLTKAALIVLSRCWPASMPWNELLEQATDLLDGPTAVSDQDIEVLRADLMQGFMVGVVLLSRMPSPFSTNPGDYPKASALAAYQANTSASVTSLRHEQIALDHYARTLLGWLDGQSSRANLKTRLHQQFPELPAQAFDLLLEGLMKAGLLTR